MWKSIALPALLLAAACGPKSGGAHVTNGTDLGTSKGPGPTADMGGTTAQDMDCGGQEFHVERVPPNVFLVIDRSGSMGNPISDGSSTSKWDDMRSAVGQLVSTYNSQINLGLSLFNSDGDCGAGKIDTAVGANNGPTITSQLQQTSPGGNTPTAATLDYVIQNASLSDPTRQNVVVLATDGQPNCDDTDVEGRISTLYNGTPSVKTFVIGVGDGTASNPDLLNSWAVAGHTDRSGATKYYQSNSASELDSAFQSIAGGLASCTFALSTTPPDPTQLYVWLDNAMVPADSTNGYTLSGMTLTLNGTSCDTLTTDTSAQLRVIYGCSTAPIL